MGTDVVALGSLIHATGPVTLPNGRTLTADEAVEFALLGVYEEFPNNAEREAFQEQVATAVFSAVTEGDVAGPALVRAISDMIGENRLQLWSSLESEQESLMQLPTSGSVAAQDGPYVYPVLINATASKLDSFIDRSIRYEVGRCDLADRVQSRLQMTVTSDIPRNAELPDYVIAQAEMTPAGPVSVTQVQIHLSPDAAVDDVRVDGEPVSPYAFREQGRPALLLTLEPHAAHAGHRHGGPERTGQRPPRRRSRPTAGAKRRHHSRGRAMHAHRMTGADLRDDRTSQGRPGIATLPTTALAIPRGEP